jgi:hypothetical protein
VNSIKASPAPIEEGTPLSSKQLNAVASINGEFVYNPAIDTVLHSGTDTLSLTFIPSDSRYRTISRTVAIQVIAKAKPLAPIPPQLPRHPLIVKSVPISGPELMVGRQLWAQINLQNVSGKILRVRSLGIGVIDTIPVSGDAEVALEDSLWQMLEDLTPNPETEINTSEDGLVNVQVRTQPLTRQDIDNLKAGVAAPYFLFYVKDSKSGRDIVEVCGRISQPGSFTNCARHNQP